MALFAADDHATAKDASKPEGAKFMKRRVSAAVTSIFEMYVEHKFKASVDYAALTLTAKQSLENHFKISPKELQFVDHIVAALLSDQPREDMLKRLTKGYYNIMKGIQGNMPPEVYDENNVYPEAILDRLTAHFGHPE